MHEEPIMVLRSALARADMVAERLLAAYRDHLDRTVRLLQSTMAILATVSAGVGLLVQMGVRFTPLAILLLLVGLLTEVIALAFFAVAYASLPGDDGTSFGPPPTVMLGRALRSGISEATWLELELRDVSDQLFQNGYVVAVLVRRRHAGVLSMAIGVVAFLSSIVFILAGQMVGR